MDKLARQRLSETLHRQANWPIYAVWLNVVHRGTCVECGNAFNVGDQIEAHHVSPTMKRSTVSELMSRTSDDTRIALIRELSVTIPLHHACHTAVTERSDATIKPERTSRSAHELVAWAASDLASGTWVVPQMYRRFIASK